MAATVPKLLTSPTTSNVFCRRSMPFVIAVAGLMLGLAQGAAAQNVDEDDVAAVRAAVSHYLEGHATGDGAHFEMVFHPESFLYWIRDNALNRRPSGEFIAGASGQPAKDEADRKRRIVMVDVTGTAAVAKVELDYPGALITDYFTLLKIDGEWKIMNKIFDVVPRG